MGILSIWSIYAGISVDLTNIFDTILSTIRLTSPPTYGKLAGLADLNEMNIYTMSPFKITFSINDHNDLLFVAHHSHSKLSI